MWECVATEGRDNSEPYTYMMRRYIHINACTIMHVSWRIADSCIMANENCEHNMHQFMRGMQLTIITSGIWADAYGIIAAYVIGLVQGS